MLDAWLACESARAPRQRHFGNAHTHNAPSRPQTKPLETPQSNRVKAEAAEEEAASSAAAAPACTAGVAYDIGTVPVAGCGGRPLRPMDLDGSETGPKAMKVTPAVPLDAMKLNQLKAELAARGARQAGLKAVLQRRLHGLLMADAVTRAASGRRTTARRRCAQGA